MVVGRPTSISAASMASGFTDSLGLGAMGSVANLVTHAPLSDVVLVAKGMTETVRIHAHRCILAARSPVFRKKFSRPMAGIQQFFNGGTYFLGSDVHPSVAKELITFIYTDDVSQLALSQHAVPLLLAAAKYAVDGLIYATERYLIDNIAPNVAAQYLTLATSRRLFVLEQAAARYIANNLSQVKMEDPQWSALSAAQCRLLMEYANHAEMAEDPSTFVTAIAKESPLIFNNIPEADKKEDTIAG